MIRDAETLSFADRAAYRAWLSENRSRERGIWIAFEKGSKRFTALDALEESLCFGWIDGVMKSIDEKTYRKYFSPRKDRSKWSDKNKALYADLARRGLMTDSGIVVYKPAPASPVDPVGKADAMAEKIQELKASLADDAEALRVGFGGMLK